MSPLDNNNEQAVRMDPSTDSYSHTRHQQELALRMIRHEARTCTIRECTGLTDDRIRRLFRVHAHELSKHAVRRHRGKSPRQLAYFVRNTRSQFESSLLASAFAAFGLLHPKRGPGSEKRPAVRAGTVEFGKMFCDAFETHQQLLNHTTLSFEHAWFLLNLLNHSGDLHAVRCRHCDSYYLRDKFNICRDTCPTCRMRRARIRHAGLRRRRPCSRVRSLAMRAD